MLKYHKFYGVMAILFLGLGGFSFLSLFFNGLYNPYGTSEYYLKVNSWSEDEKKLQFLAESPSVTVYEIQLANLTFQTAKNESTRDFYDEPKLIEEELLDTYSLEDRFGKIKYASWSPNQNYYVFVSQKRLSHFPASEWIIYTETLHLADSRTNKIIFETNRRQLLSSSEIKLWGLVITFVDYQKFSTGSLALGAIFLGLWLLHSQKSFVFIIKFLASLIALYVMLCCCYIYLWIPSMP